MISASLSRELSAKGFIETRGKTYELKLKEIESRIREACSNGFYGISIEVESSIHNEIIEVLMEMGYLVIVDKIWNGVRERHYTLAVTWKDKIIGK